MRLSLMPEFLPGETVIKESQATRYYQRGLNGGSSNGKLWLTNQRIIFKAGFGYQMSLPLYNLSRVEPGVYSLFNFKVLQLTFDDGREERFSIYQPESWPEAAWAAKAGALPLPEALPQLVEREKTANTAVLDSACGNGLTSRRLAVLGAEVVAFDFAEEMIAHA